MKASRITAVGLVAAAGLWILSGHLIPHESGESKAALRIGETKAEKRFRVAMIETNVVSHSRKLMLSGRTEADRKVVVFARTNGMLQELRVRRGAHVKKGDIIAILSDDAREAQVMQAKALFEQRTAELEAKRRLLATFAIAKLELNVLEAQHKAAEAALATAEAERERGIITAPWDGVITEVSEVGTSAFAFAGKEIAQIVGLDPMLAVVEVSERKVANVKVGDMAEVKLVSGPVRSGRIRYVSKSAVPATRTYRVEVELPNADNVIPDGITAEVIIPLQPLPATRVPRSALVVSSSGDIGVRTVDAESKVGFVSATIVEDDQKFMWLTGLPDGARVIVQGQDFVREGNLVEPVAAPVAAEQAQR
ncbi:MAG: efflux RND transporter periplasmic adaptor subunit [Hyphomicrobiales bacterium]|nr:efflux RND transporter periplasmic adaptor subunit [Alphaproteobacteria bacterium]